MRKYQSSLYSVFWLKMICFLFVNNNDEFMLYHEFQATQLSGPMFLPQLLRKRTELCQNFPPEQRSFRGQMSLRCIDKCQRIQSDFIEVPLGLGHWSYFIQKSVFQEHANCKWISLSPLPPQGLIIASTHDRATTFSNTFTMAQSSCYTCLIVQAVLSLHSCFTMTVLKQLWKALTSW